MSNVNNNIIKYKDSCANIVTDELSLFLKESAQKMLRVAIEDEVNNFISSHSGKHLSSGHKQIVRNGYLPERKIHTGIGSISVSVPRTRDRSSQGITFNSSLIPKHMRRTVSLDLLLPLLYLKGISTKDFASSFVPILGHNPKNMSSQVISNLKSSWINEYNKWQEEDLSCKQYIYIWADGIYLQARSEDEKQCILVIIGADEYGRKEVVAISDGYRESKESWLELLSDLKSRGLSYSPHIAVGDGSLGFWGALSEIYPKCKHQRCWVHKLRNILNKLPSGLQEKAKSKLHNIYMADTKKNALKAYNHFITLYGAKYPKAIECLDKDKDELLSFYDFPAEHWIHIRTTNPIESTFATVRHRTKKSKNCFSRNTILAATFKLIKEAEKRWNPLRGKNRIAEVIQLHKFIDGINHTINQNNLTHKRTNINKMKQFKYAA